VHATHAFVPASHTGVMPVHAPAFPSVHSTHAPALHTGSAGSNDAQLACGSAVPSQSTHACPSQNGVGASQSSLPSHGPPPLSLDAPSVALTPVVVALSVVLALVLVPALVPVSLALLVGPLVLAVVLPSATPQSGSSARLSPPPHGL
jgi:hypothetical protein